MNPILTDAGRAYIADRDALDLPVVLNLFKLGNPAVGGSTPTDPLATQTDQTSVVWSGPPTAEGLLNADSVAYSLLVGTDQGDFEVTQIGLWSDTGVLVYVANIPTFYKRASGPGVFGNNFVFNANIVYAGIAALAEMQAAAETWQQDFTALLALKQDLAEKGQADGYASLDGTGDVPLAQIPDTLTGKDADTLDGSHLAAVQLRSEKGAANGYASLDGAGTVPLAEIPATLTGKDADTLDGSHLAAVQLRSEKGAANGYAGLDGAGIVAQSVASIRETGAGAGDLKSKIIAIGDWNMDSTTSVTLAHGLMEENIRSVSASILIDPEEILTRYSLEGTASTGALGGQIRWDGTNVYLIRATSGFFDGVLFNSTSFNRGWITIWYV